MTDANYKFNALRFFNWDNVKNNNKIYRQVFDRAELTYLGAEISFYNKKFDEEAWKATFGFKAFVLDDDKKGKQICEMEKTLEIGREHNFFTVEKGWGEEERGEYWHKGSYLWEAYIDGKLVASEKCYIENLGVYDPQEVNAFTPVSLKVFEGSDEKIPEEKRKYLRRFNSKKTRYVWGEFKLMNNLNHPWLGEFFFNYFDDTGQLIGRISSVLVVPDTIEFFNITNAWGSNEPDTFKQDDYTLEIEFQENTVAVVPFAIGKKEKKAVKEEMVIHPYHQEDKSETSNETEMSSSEDHEEEKPDPAADGSEISGTTENEESDDLQSPEDQFASDEEMLSETLAELDELIGLEEIKEQIRKHIKYLQFIKVRQDLGFHDREEIVLHSVFTGNPGTGKTTVVKMLGKIYKGMGLLSKGHVHTVDSADLVSGYVRQTGKDTAKQIDEARGGILFIDEAYALYRKADNDFGPEAIQALITEMSDGPGDVVIMLAGYPVEMEEMINSNPGLKSRIRHYYHFPDYTPEELIKIADYAARTRQVEFSPEGRKKLHKELIDAYRDRDRTFGNARLAHSLVEEAKIHLGVRIMSRLGEDELNRDLVKTIEAADVISLSEQDRSQMVDIPIDEPLLADAMEELSELTGLENIKQEVRDMIKLVRYYRDMNRNARKAFPLHCVFTGNPGTGKTTVARILGKVYKALGMLERGHLVETDSGDLIAGWLGQTAGKTKEKVMEAMGGVLFIDEAYSLSGGDHPDFGRKAISTLLKQMEDHRGEFSVIVAGYTSPMKDFIQSNPGLRSRFDITFPFADFTAEELKTIAVNMLKSRNLKMTKEAKNHLSAYLKYLYSTRNQFFGNARSVRKVVERIVRNQHIRMASTPKPERTARMMKEVILKDVDQFKEEQVQSGGAIGFKFGNH